MGRVRRPSSLPEMFFCSTDVDRSNAERIKWLNSRHCLDSVIQMTKLWHVQRSRSPSPRPRSNTVDPSGCIIRYVASGAELTWPSPLRKAKMTSVVATSPQDALGKRMIGPTTTMTLRGSGGGIVGAGAAHRRERVYERDRVRDSPAPLKKKKKVRHCRRTGKECSGKRAAAAAAAAAQQIRTVECAYQETAAAGQCRAAFPSGPDGIGACGGRALSRSVADGGAGPQTAEADAGVSIILRPLSPAFVRNVASDSPLFLPKSKTSVRQIERDVGAISSMACHRLSPHPYVVLPSQGDRAAATRPLSADDLPIYAKLDDISASVMEGTASESGGDAPSLSGRGAGGRRRSTIAYMVHRVAQHGESCQQRCCQMYSLLGIMQICLGVITAAVAIYLPHLSDSISLTDATVWSGVTLGAAGFTGMAYYALYRRRPKLYRGCILKTTCAALSGLSVLLCAAGSLLSGVHGTRIAAYRYPCEVDIGDALVCICYEENEERESGNGRAGIAIAGDDSADLAAAYMPTADGFAPPWARHVYTGVSRVDSCSGNEDCCDVISTTVKDYLILESAFNAVGAIVSLYLLLLIWRAKDRGGGGRGSTAGTYEMPGKMLAGCEA